MIASLSTNQGRNNHDKTVEGCNQLPHQSLHQPYRRNYTNQMVYVGNVSLICGRSNGYYTTAMLVQERRQDKHAPTRERGKRLTGTHLLKCLVVVLWLLFNK